MWLKNSWELCMWYLDNHSGLLLLDAASKRSVHLTRLIPSTGFYLRLVTYFLTSLSFESSYCWVWSNKLDLVAKKPGPACHHLSSTGQDIRDRCKIKSFLQLLVVTSVLSNLTNLVCRKTWLCDLPRSNYFILSPKYHTRLLGNLLTPWKMLCSREQRQRSSYFDPQILYFTKHFESKIRQTINQH